MLERGAYGELREETIAAARQRVHALAREGLQAVQIEARLGHALTRTEREVLRPMIRSEVHRASHPHVRPRPTAAPVG